MTCVEWMLDDTYALSPVVLPLQLNGFRGPLLRLDVQTFIEFQDGEAFLVNPFEEMTFIYKGKIKIDYFGIRTRYSVFFCRG